MRADRSRSPFDGPELLHPWVLFEDRMCLDTIPEEDVGNALDLASGSLSSGKGGDVHQVNVGGEKSWVLNEKPKKRAEVHFRRLCDEDKLDFLKAMQCELGSYLEHEAVEIARRHNVPKERIMGMRWVLTWKGQ